MLIYDRGRPWNIYIYEHSGIISYDRISYLLYGSCTLPTGEKLFRYHVYLKSKQACVPKNLNKERTATNWHMTPNDRLVCTQHNHIHYFSGVWNASRAVFL